MRIAVTGASGFCGGAVARLAAAQGAEVVSLGRRPGPVGAHVPWDATSRDAPAMDGVDAVIHLAAAVGDQGRGPALEAKFRVINVDATARLLDAAGHRPVVWVSSASVYRPGPYARPIHEDHPIDSQRTAYGRTKAAGERLALAAGAVVLRPRAVYGDGDRHLLPRMRRLVLGRRAWLPGPDVPLSLTSVRNLADACLAALPDSANDRVRRPGLPGVPDRQRRGRSASAGDGWASGAYNIADATPYRRDAVVAAVLEVPVRHLPLGLIRSVAAVTARLAERPALTPYAIDQLTDGMVLDTTRARAAGWQPRQTLTDYLHHFG